MPWWSVGAVFVFGALIGAAELVSRHSDYRFRALATLPSVAYLLLNGLLSIFALMIMELARPQWLGYPAAGDAPPSQPLWIILAAGFSAAAFFRSSIFKVKTPDGEIAVGPSLVVDVFLSVIDETVDRSIGQRRLMAVSEIMKGLEFSNIKTDLPTLCLATLQRLPEESQRQLGLQIQQLSQNAELGESVKTSSLGLLIMKVTGLPILREGVAELRKALAEDGRARGANS